MAQFDFTARSQRELSFKKGDLLTLYTQVSGDWWKGSKDGRDGLVPDKYIMLRIRFIHFFITSKFWNFFLCCWNNFCGRNLFISCEGCSRNCLEEWHLWDTWTRSARVDYRSGTSLDWFVSSVWNTCRTLRHLEHPLSTENVEFPLRGIHSIFSYWNKVLELFLKIFIKKMFWNAQGRGPWANGNGQGAERWKHDQQWFGCRINPAADVEFQRRFRIRFHGYAHAQSLAFITADSDRYSGPIRLFHASHFHHFRFRSVDRLFTVVTFTQVRFSSLNH